MPYWFQEVMHQIALLPVLTLLVLLRWRPPSVSHWMISGAIALSWVADSMNFALLEHASLVTIMRLLWPLQLVVVLWIAIGGRQYAVPLLGGMAILAIASAVQGARAFDLVVPIIGGFLVLLNTKKFTQGFMRSGIMVHFGLGALTWAAFAIAATQPGRAAFITWYGFQGTRLAGILLITAAMVQRARQPRIGLV